MADRKGAPPRAWQRMLSGRRLDLLEPSPLDVEVDDIAHGLARVARWNGQTSGAHAFSVAQHSVLVEAIFHIQHPDADAATRLMVLLHDAPEYVIGDMISPFKTAMGGSYKDIEARLQEAVHLRYGLPADTPPRLKSRIKKADLVSAYLEATQLAGFDKTEAKKFFGEPSPDVLFEITPLPTEQAQQLFLQRFEQLDQERRGV